MNIIPTWGELMRIYEDPKSTPAMRRFATRALYTLADALGWA